MEFALVAPLFLMLLFGIVEYSLINASIGAYNFAAKEGARFGAIVGNGASPQPAISLDQYMVNNIIVPHVVGVVMAQMTQVVIFKATEAGACYFSGTPPNCTGAGSVDILQNSGGTWQSTNCPGASGSTCWNSSSRNDNLSNADYLGVDIVFKYTYLTAFFATTTPTITLNAISVQRIEPQQYGDRDAPTTTAMTVTTTSSGLSWMPQPFSHMLTLFNFTALTPRREDSHRAGAPA